MLRPDFMPAQSFPAENRTAIEGILDLTRADYPGLAVPDQIFDESSQTLTQEAMDFMWRRFMGIQHSMMEVGDHKKLNISGSPNVQNYWEYVRRLHYGTHSFTQPSPLRLDVEYTKGLVPGGVPDGVAKLVKNLLGGIDDQQISDLVVMAGQAPRIRWAGQIPSEASPDAVFDSLVSETGVDMDEWRRRSPWIAEDERLPYVDEWHGPLATEFETGRLAVEATLFSRIDWSEGVEFTDAVDAPMEFFFEGVPYEVPDRQFALATYRLRNGMRAHVLNGRAANRDLGKPRPSSDSQATEIVQYLPPDDSRRDVVAVSTALPHVRVGLDVGMRMAWLLKDRITSLDITTIPWLGHSTIEAALGEIPATTKSGERLEAALRGESPDTPELRRR